MKIPKKVVAVCGLAVIGLSGCSGSSSTQPVRAETVTAEESGPPAEDLLYVSWNFLSQGERDAFCKDFQMPEGRAQLYRSFVSGAGHGSSPVTISEFNAFFFPRC
jgi:hypothetical protein